MGKEAKLLSEATNFAVVQLPGRNFPGVVIQGDTLHSLVAAIREVQVLLGAGRYADLADEIENIHEQLYQALTRYEATCEKNQINLPYRKT